MIGLFLEFTATRGVGFFPRMISWTSRVMRRQGKPCLDWSKKARFAGSCGESMITRASARFSMKPWGLIWMNWPVLWRANRVGGFSPLKTRHSTFWSFQRRCLHKVFISRMARARRMRLEIASCFSKKGVSRNPGSNIVRASWWFRP